MCLFVFFFIINLNGDILEESKCLESTKEQKNKLKWILLNKIEEKKAYRSKMSLPFETKSIFELFNNYRIWWRKNENLSLTNSFCVGWEISFRHRHRVVTHNIIDFPFIYFLWFFFNTFFFFFKSYILYFIYAY